MADSLENFFCGGRELLAVLEHFILNFSDWSSWFYSSIFVDRGFGVYNLELK